jgi:hypothetical protein
MITRFKLATVAASIMLGLAMVSGAQAAHTHGYVKMMHVTMEDGTTHDYEVVKTHGHMMVLVPEDEVYEALHQTPFKKTPQ